ncbi:hypothetical protein [Nocardia asteroides]|uniref:hypothetical protein n=1 Tax=Nocardia asteroides TaxID=1824 RepID=UPI001E419D9F|nr:hypothetical protein [Nocardia asteroides]UGT62578.1 hypothetical protein LTT61_04320 [Nocardia asteroides]
MDRRRELRLRHRRRLHTDTVGTNSYLNDMELGRARDVNDAAFTDHRRRISALIEH